MPEIIQQPTQRDVYVIVRMTKGGEVRAIGPASKTACEDRVKAVAHPIGTAEPIFWFDNVTGDTIYQIVPLIKPNWT